jgi:hypothetical protein
MVNRPCNAILSDRIARESERGTFAKRPVTTKSQGAFHRARHVGARPTFASESRSTDVRSRRERRNEATLLTSEAPFIPKRGQS